MRSCPIRRVRFGLRASATTRSASCPTRCRPAARSTGLAGSPKMPARGDQVGDYATVLVDVPFCPESGRCADIAGLRIRANWYGPAARYKMASKVDERESCNNVLGL